jgi:hypothetical protein
LSCFPGNHFFHPFPDSYRLYCHKCGDTLDEHRESSQQVRRSYAAQREEPPQPVDPDLEDARELLDENALRNKLVEILESAGVGDPEATQYLRQAMDFGEHIDLDAFAEQMNALGKSLAEKHPQPLYEDLIDGD